MAEIPISIAGMVALLARAERELTRPAEDESGVFHEAMKRACVMVMVEAQSSIGEYQAASGPFPAWAPLAEATKQDRARQGYAPDDPLFRTGEMSRSIQWTIKGHTGHVGSDDDRAVYQELGTGRIPARSFLGASAFRKEYAIHKLFARAAVGVFGVSNGRHWSEMERMVLPVGPATGAE